MVVKAQLEKLYHQYGSDIASRYGLSEPDIANYPWTFETNRWISLVSCLLQQFAGKDVVSTSEAVTALRFLDLLDVDRLASISKAQGSSEDVTLAVAVLKRYGFSSDAAQSAIRVLANTASVVQHNYGGKIQYYLRKQGQVMVDELTDALAHADLEESQVRYAVTLWLQNVLNMPMLLAHQAVLNFCGRHGITPDDLLAAADELDLNIAVVDDLLTIEAESVVKNEEAQPVARSKKSRPRKAKR